MELVNLHNITSEQLESFLVQPEGAKSIFSRLASSQTGNDRTVTRERIEYILHSSDHLMFLAMDNEQLIGMAIGQRVTGINNSYMYIHDVVVDPNTRGGGVGSQLMEKLMEAGKQQWPEIVRIQLTSRPSRGTSTFFEKLGFRARTKESGDETIVYVMDLGNYNS